MGGELMTAYHPVSILPPAIIDRLLSHRITKSMRRKSRVYQDTTDFTSIDYGDVICVDGRYFVVTSYTKEGRFGVDEQIKPWVPKVEDLASGEKFIVKLVFHETFTIRLSHFTIPYYRSPEKEARVLELTKGEPHFMQGKAALDEAGNLVRILDIINGYRLDNYIHRSGTNHEEYYYTELPGILKHFLPCLEGISLLHNNDLRHGDIRRDHVFVDRRTGIYKWIDFDYDYYIPEKPYSIDLFELGNILIYLVGKGDFFMRDLPQLSKKHDCDVESLVPGDYSLLARTKIINLKKIYPYMSEKLNNILLHFSAGTDIFYENIAEISNDIDLAVTAMKRYTE